MRRFLLLCTIIMIIAAFLPLSAQAADPIDTDADPVPIVSSGSFTCDTWIHTRMDSFSVEGGELTGASWNFGQGYISYNLTGTFTPGETLSLSIAGTMGEMGYQMQHVGNNLRFQAKYYDKSGQELTDLKRMKAFDKSSNATMTDEISVEAFDYVKKIELHGSFSCNWRTPYSSASETVAVKVILESKSEPEPIPTTIEPSINETPVKTQETQIPTSSKPSWEPPEVPFPKNPDDPIWETFSRNKVKFADMHGEVNVKRYSEDDDAYIFAELDTPLYHGCVIRTLPQSGAILSFGDMTSFVMKPDTIIILDLEYPEESKIKLVAGNTWTNLKQMIKDGSMEVEMSQGVSGIKGTTFICEEKDGVSTLKVFEGQWN